MANLNTIYGIYYDMKKRCYDKKYLLYDTYGAKGVRICSEWLNDRGKFIEWSKENGYKNGMRIKMIDSKKGYSPENCYFYQKETGGSKTKKNKAIKGSCAGERKYRGDEIKKLLKVEKYIESPIYRAYYAMMDRCYNPNNKSYKWYGGKGIRVCDEWSEKIIGFERFAVWSLENGWKEGLSIDRMENNKDYCPKNCRWATVEQQLMNRTISLNFWYNGEYKNLSEISRETNLCYTSLYGKIFRDGYSLDEAIDYLRKRRKGAKGSMFHSKQVAQIDGNGKIIKVFPSAKSAADSYGKLSGSLTKACRNGTTWLGKRWKYITEDEYNKFLNK